MSIETFETISIASVCPTRELRCPIRRSGRSELVVRGGTGNDDLDDAVPVVPLARLVRLERRLGLGEGVTASRVLDQWIEGGRGRRRGDLPVRDERREIDGAAGDEVESEAVDVGPVPGREGEST